MKFKFQNLKEIVNYFKKLRKKLSEFIKNKLFHSNDYYEVINKLQDNNILSEEDIEIIHGEEKDDFEL